MSICDIPFNSDFSSFNANNDEAGAKKYIDDYNKCLEDKIKFFDDIAQYILDRSLFQKN